MWKNRLCLGTNEQFELSEAEQIRLFGKSLILENKFVKGREYADKTF